MAATIARCLAALVPTSAIIYIAGQGQGERIGRYTSLVLPDTPRSLSATSQNRMLKDIDWTRYGRETPAFRLGDTVFSFGIDSNHFLATRNTPSDRLRWQAQTKKGSLTSTQLRHTLSDLYFFAFTPYGDELAAWLDTYTDRATWALRLDPYRPAQAPTYTSLLRWMGKHVPPDDSSLRQSFVVFGAGSTCFARSRDDCFWQDLPPALENVIIEKKEDCVAETRDQEGDKNAWIPRIVALGADQSYVAIWQDGRCVWSLSKANRLLEDLDEEEDGDDLPAVAFENIVLNPHSATGYFSALKDGRLHYSFSNMDKADMVSLTAQMYCYMQTRAKQDGTTFEFVPRINGKEYDLTLSPTTNWTEEQLKRFFR